MKHMNLVAYLSPVDPYGQFRLEIPDVGLCIEHLYAVNRAAKILFLAGVVGTFTTRDRETGAVRLCVNIEGYGRKRLSETDLGGFKWEPWTENSLAPLRKLAQKVRRTLKDSRNVVLGGDVPNKPEKPSVAPSARERVQ